MAADGNIIELQGVSKIYRAPGGAETQVLQGIDLTVARGESIAIMGPSGSGKSTLLNLMGTLDRPTSGRVILEGRDLSTLDEKDLPPIRARVVGFIFQMHHLLPQLSVLENVLVPAIVAEGAAAAGERARKLLDRVGLTARLSHRPGQLSGGECQRVAVARALINRPRLLLADEPTGSLDRAGAESISELLGGLQREEGVALVTVTHARERAPKAGRVLELRDGVLK